MVAMFVGIPYAEQPIGELRFRRLQPLSGRLDPGGEPYGATHFEYSSIQSYRDQPFSTGASMGEDCIYLNVFATMNGDDFQESANSRKQPVFFLIPGGGFVLGSGSEPQNDLKHFAAHHGAVGVSINYRLNILGFMSHPPLIEDNLGLLDQQFALQWCHENIASFGGDPHNITIFGCGAG